MPSCSACEPDASRGCEKEDPGGLEIRRGFNMGVDEFGGDGLDRGEADLVDELAHLLDEAGASTVASAISLLLSYSGAARPLPFLTARTHPRPSPTTLRARGGCEHGRRAKRPAQTSRPRFPDIWRYAERAELHRHTAGRLPCHTAIPGIHGRGAKHPPLAPRPPTTVRCGSDRLRSPTRAARRLSQHHARRRNNTTPHAAAPRPSLIPEGRVRVGRRALQENPSSAPPFVQPPPSPKAGGAGPLPTAGRQHAATSTAT